MPVGAFGGKEEIMRHVAPLGPVYQAGTLSANPVTLSAGIAVIQQLLEPGFYEEMESKTEHFVSKIQEHCSEHNYNLLLQSIGSIFWMSFSGKRAITADDIDGSSGDVFKALHAKLLDKGVYLGPSGYEVGFVSAAHSYEDLDTAADIIIQCLDEVFNA